MTTYRAEGTLTVFLATEFDCDSKDYFELKRKAIDKLRIEAQDLLGDFEFFDSDIENISIEESE